ncbi:hypothetical protein C2S52_009796 [Perilla frutescens var. hirtella]|nr:hypothetical protein C2S52_009796 [Perilla frutescens var. hirtella]
MQEVSSDSTRVYEKENATDEERVTEIHLTLREVHRAIHDEQVFDLVNREACNPSLRVNLTGIKENYLRLSIGERSSVSLTLASSGQDDQPIVASDRNTVETSNDTSEKSGVSRQLGFEIYLRQLFHEYVFVRAKSKAIPLLKSQIPGQPPKDKSNILGHGLNLSVFMNLKVHRTPYVQLISHSTWHSRTSSWTLSVKIPESILHAAIQIQTPRVGNVKAIRSQFWTKVVVIDDSISVQGEGVPNVLSLFKGKSEGVSSINGYDCDLAYLPIILLQQVASQIIQWLHEEALTIGIKANRDFLSLAFELEQGEIARLVAHVDPEDAQGCISWWLTIDDGLTEEHKLSLDMSYFESQSKKFLGYLPLDLLHSTLLNFLNLSSY